MVRHQIADFGQTLQERDEKKRESTFQNSTQIQQRAIEPQALGQRRLANLQWKQKCPNEKESDETISSQENMAKNVRDSKTKNKCKETTRVSKGGTACSSLTQ